jgi:phage-related minor tail protein
MPPSDPPIETWTVAINADTSILQDQLKTASLSGKQFSTALTAAFDGLALKGKSLNDVFSTLALSLSKMALQAAFKPLEKGLGTALSGLLGGGGQSAFANGGVFQGGVPTPFADGGVIQSPIAFPLGGGQTGIAGERGAEAIMPLARGSDGKLGIAGGGGSSMNVTFNVQATDADSFGRSETQIAALLSRAVALGQRNL